MKKLTILSAILSVSCFSSLSFAADSSYRAEMSAGYGQFDADSDSDTTGYGLSGTYYFSGVDTKNHPLAEAAFLENSSNVYARWAREDYDGLDGNTDVSVVGADFYAPNSMLFLGAGITKVDVNDGFGPDDDTAWFAKIGVTPVDGLLVWSQFYEDVDVSDHWNINAKYVVPLAGETAINLEAGYADWDDGDNTTSIGADYYFNRSFSLGAGYTFADENDGYELRARNFFSEKFSVEAAYTSNDIEDGWLVGASLRF